MHARWNGLALVRADVGSTFGMFIMSWSSVLTAGLVVAAEVAHAQSTATPMTNGSGTKLRYESAFADYRPFAEIELLPWKRANSDAANLGGQMGRATVDSMPNAGAHAATTTKRPALDSPPTGHAVHPIKVQP